MFGFFKNMMNGVGATLESLKDVERDREAHYAAIRKKSANAAGITDNEVRKLIAIVNEFPACSHLEIHSREREVSGYISGVKWYGSGPVVSFHRGMFGSDTWGASLDNQELALSSSQRQLIADFMWDKHGKPSVIEPGDARKLMGWADV